MKWKSLKQKTWFKILTNRYIFVLLVFLVWMLFFDTNSWLTHHKLDQEITEIKNNINYYKSEIEKDKKKLQSLRDSVEIEKFARENYFMKRKNEDVFIIKYEDSLN